MNNNIIIQITNFIKSIGIDVFFEPVTGAAFLPGIAIRNGCLVVDTDKLLYPGDILHEAGHIAVTPLARRAALNDNVDVLQADGGNEMAAIAWSYAACKHIGLDTSFVFHEHGYKGAGGHLAKNFDEGKYVGVPLLQYYGMAFEPHKAAEFNKKPFPMMYNWLSQQ